MNNIINEILIVFGLSLLNGFFACSEIALVSVRKTRISSLVRQGNKRAQMVQQLQSKPERLFATIQVGVSIITIFASAFAGERIALEFSQLLGRTSVPFIAQHNFAIGFIVAVAIISFISLLFGELIPKSLGLRFAERFSLLAAFPVWWFSKITSWIVKLLDVSANLILKPFKASRRYADPRLSEEEIRILISEGRQAGTIDQHEHNIIQNVFEFADMTVGKIMVPRTQITAFDVDENAGEIFKQAILSGYSRLPVYEGNLNSIVGILYTKELLPKLGTSIDSLKVREFLVPPYFVPGSMQISEVLRRLQRKKLHMALVTDEHGEIEGLITLEDILEEIVGDISDETDEVKKDLIKNADGSFTVAGELSVVDFNKQTGFTLPEDDEFSTVSGFILDKLARFPDVGDAVEFGSLIFEVKEKTLRTVKTAVVRVKKEEDKK